MKKKSTTSKVEYICDDRKEGLRENRPIPPDLLKEIISDYQSGNSNYKKQQSIANKTN